MSSTKKLKAAHKAFLGTLNHDARIRVVHVSSQLENNNTDGNSKNKT